MQLKTIGYLLIKIVTMCIIVLKIMFMIYILVTKICACNISLVDYFQLDVNKTIGMNGPHSIN